jgi:hypothetical protein
MRRHAGVQTAQLRLERADHIADRRLRDLQLSGSGTEVARATDFQEHLDLAERK